MIEAEAWLTQVDSDWELANLIASHRTAALRCQEAAKYQQVVEKSLNAIDASFRQLGLIRGRARAEHYPLHIINRLVTLPLGRGTGSIEYVAQKVLTKQAQVDVYDLCRLAPRLPAQGEHYSRNTEYPYNLGSEQNWTAPAADQSFTLAELVRHQRTARRLRAAAHGVFTTVNVS